MFAALPSFASDRTLEDESSPTIVFRKVAVSGDTFDEQYVVKRSREFLANNTDKKLIRYTLVPDTLEATIGASGCDHCDPYPFWRVQYDAVARQQFPIGELTAIGGNAVVRYRNMHGTVTETVLKGATPRPITIGSFNGTIAHVGMSGRMPTPWLELYVVGTGIISSDAGAAFIAKFSHEMGVMDSTVELRSDPWFMNEIWRTWFPLFEEHRGNPPSEREFNATKTLNCVVVLTVSGKTTNECSWKGTAHLP
jgi:hypothetical protein